MRLPATLLVCLVACEPAHRGDPAPVVTLESDEPVRMSPMAAPRFAQPSPSPPPPRVKLKPKLRLVKTMACGREQLLPPDVMIGCGQG